MTSTKHSLIAICVLASGSLLSACGDIPAQDGGIQVEDDDGDLRAELSEQGLIVEDASFDHVAGSFERRGIGILFDLWRDADSRHLVITSLSGEPIVDSTLRAGVDTMSIFGGRAVLTGPVEASPTVEGDPDAVEDIATSPEALLLPELKEALIAHDFANPVYNEDDAQGIGKRTQALSQGWFDGTYHHLPYGASYDLWSWTFWGTTTVLIAREEDAENGFAAAMFQPGISRPEYVSGYGTQRYRRQWWGARVFVTNTLLPLCTADGSWCQDTTIIAANW